MSTMKLFIFLIMGSLANAFNLNSLLHELEEEARLGDVDSADEFGLGPIKTGRAPNLGHGLRKEGETKISYENQMDVPMWVQFNCDQQLITSDTTKYTQEFDVAYKDASAGMGFSQEETKEYMYKMADRTGKYSKVGPNDYLEEKAPECMADLVYVTIFNFGSEGSPNFFLNLSGMGQGERVVVSASNPDYPHSEKDANICFGENCGCHNKYCWSYCSFGAQWCYTTKGSSQSHDYVTCNKERECLPDWHCGGACSL